jgi:hypothetical protein
VRGGKRERGGAGFGDFGNSHIDPHAASPRGLSGGGLSPGGGGGFPSTAAALAAIAEGAGEDFAFTRTTIASAHGECPLKG